VSVENATVENHLEELEAYKAHIEEEMQNLENSEHGQETHADRPCMYIIDNMREDETNIQDSQGDGLSSHREDAHTTSQVDDMSSYSDCTKRSTTEDTTGTNIRKFLQLPHAGSITTTKKR